MTDVNELNNTKTEITVKEAVETISALDPRTPVFLWGAPGIGKTKTIIDKFGNQLNHKVIPVLAGQSEPTDLTGIPFNYENLYAKYVVPWWGFLASDHPEVPKEYQEPTVLFFDDLPTAPEQVQAAFYKIVDEKIIGDLNIRENVRIIAAGNRLDDMSAVTDMPKALCNRFMHLYVRPDIDTWLEFAVKNGIHPHVVFFLRQNQQYLSQFNDALESTETHAFATPRTWEMLSRSLFELEEKNLRGDNHEVDYEGNILQGCIGKLGPLFRSTISTKYHAIPIEDIISDPENAQIPDISEPDRLYATVSNLEHWFLQPQNHKHYSPYLTYANRLPEDFGILLIRQITHLITVGKVDSEVLTELMESSDIHETLDKWSKKFAGLSI